MPYIETQIQHVKTFLENECVADPGARTRTSTLCAAYNAWLAKRWENGDRRGYGLKPISFGRACAMIGLPRTTINGFTYAIGLTCQDLR